MKSFSVYKPDVCCSHEWVHISHEMDGSQHQFCNKCKAECRRDEKGLIINYSLNHEHKIYPGDAFSYDLKVDPKRYLHRRDY